MCERAGEGEAVERQVALGYDHAGFALAQVLSSHLVGAGVEVWHFGPVDDESPVDYVPFCVAAALAVAERDVDFGIVLGGSGQGEQMAANKVDGIRAALCLTTEFAMMARRDNDANVLALPARFVADHYARQIVDTWIATEFEGGRHARRLADIDKYESSRYNSSMEIPLPTSKVGP
jgi:ribose 5-phosphate isomerase B